MSPRLFDPLETLLRLQRALDSARMEDWYGGSTGGRGAFPPINVFQRDGGGYVVVAELPGLDRESLTVEVHQNQLRLAGERTTEVGEEASIHRRERSSGSFDRTVTLPDDIDREATRATYHDGILTIELSRRPEESPRSIEIG